jgi:hypothetical protein
LQNYNYKLFEFFVVLEPKKLAKARDLLTAPYFNTESVIIELFDLMISIPADELVTMHYSMLFEQMTKAKKYSDAYKRILMSKLQNVLEKFVFLEYSEIDKLNLAKTFREQKLYKNYVAQLNQLENEYELLTDNVDSLFLKIQLYEEQINKLTHLSKADIDSLHTLTLKGDEYLDKYIVLLKLKTLNSLYNFKKTNDKEYVLGFETEILEIVGNDKFNEVLIILFYKNAFLLQSNNDETAFLFLKESLINKKVELSIEDKNEILSLLNNFCIRKINSQAFEYFNELFSLYKFSVTEKLVIQNGVIPQTSFKNIVQIAIRVQDLEWAKSFIKEFKEYINEAEKENAFYFTSSMIYFSESNFSKAIKELSKVDFDKFHFDTEARILLCKCYYECEELDALDSLIISFKRLLQRKTNISKTILTLYKNFLKTLSVLYTLHPRDKKKIFALKQEIEDNKLVAEKLWLLEKVNHKISLLKI